ncbi:RNA polymerase-binding protein RbpA [Jatrophihabitans lederbergiae]|uniref:RNA polymerase-binding protein RbpA n=1 Tax=Jatrophihabitans lederbergiae TaxID=3075547 RepID=A0ABU2J876_9ACTN|nr:RNA polymerase-binding protein RbpA [Jatrophihabitans sp. DSM 44399]MDT0260719.1 RNA polymerase-binding protein RbpA [Jatrophihabitans sp. DSM 44399]
MAGGSAIRGSRVGAGPMGERERGESAPRQWISFFCSNGHETVPAFAVDALVPDTWDCPRCGFPAGRESATPPAAPRNEPYKTHLAYVKERRSDADGDALLEEALARLRARRGER